MSYGDRGTLPPASRFPAPPRVLPLSDATAAELAAELPREDVPMVMAKSARVLAERWGVPGFEVANRNIVLVMAALAAALLHGGPALVGGTEAAGDA